MSSDIKLNDGPDRTWVTIEASVIDTTASDLILDAESRRGAEGGGQRRALVHDQGDGLTVNYDGDYPGGVTINDARLQLQVIGQHGTAPRLPKSARLGEMILIRNRTTMAKASGGFESLGETVTLWLCTGFGPIGGDAWWSPVTLGDGVAGTE